MLGLLNQLNIHECQVLNNSKIESTSQKHVLNWSFFLFVLVLELLPKRGGAGDKC